MECGLNGPVQCLVSDYGGIISTVEPKRNTFINATRTTTATRDIKFITTATARAAVVSD